MQELQGEAQRLYQAGEAKWGTDESVFTQIFTTIFILIGGFNLDKCRGEIRLYMIKKRDINEFIYVQDIEIIDDEYNNFYGIAMPINNLIQTKNSGKIVVTTIDGHVFLFSKPNLDYYNKKNKR